MDKLWKIFKAMIHAKLAVGFTVCMIMTFITGYIHYVAPKIGENVGEATGNVVGLAIGSADGLFNGLSEGSNAGAKVGLSAEDTDVEIKGRLEEIGKLEVMTAGVTLKKMTDIGEAYKNLSIMKGNAVYTIDSSQVQVNPFEDGSGYHIMIPLPEMELYLDVNSTEELASKQSTSWSVSAEDALQGYLNSVAQMTDRADEAISNYDMLMEMAKETAVGQVKVLANTFSAKNVEIEVTYQ